MSDTSLHLHLPFLAPAQAQKHITHNEALRSLDVIIHLAVINRTTPTPPATPVDGMRLIIPVNADGVWADKASQVASFQDGVWDYISPKDGWGCFVMEEHKPLIFLSGEWQDVIENPDVLNAVSQIGVNAVADETNRFSVSAEASLLSHEGASHNLKINKATTVDTASLLFQKNFSSYAEVGLVESDDLSIKVSADGDVFQEAIRIDRNTGKVSFPLTTLSTDLTVQQDGVSQSAEAVSLNFLGSGVAVTETAAGSLNISIPGAGGTGNVPSGGQTGEFLVKTSSADFDADWALPVSDIRDLAFPMHSDALIAEWYFNEGAGPVIHDRRGGYDIVIDEAFRAAYDSQPEWTRRGLRLKDSMVQTPVIHAVKTIAFAFRVKRGDETGFLFSGGPQGSGNGLLGGSSAASWNCHIGGGQGVAPLGRRASGQRPSRLNRGGWQVTFVEFDIITNTICGFGGRHSALTSRCEDYEVAWAACWSDVLTGSERDTIYDNVRQILTPRGIYLDWRDCTETVDCMLLWGQSNADGRALLTDLSSADSQRRHLRNSLISPGSGGGAYASPEALVLGDNQNTDQTDIYFGPEMGAAWAHDDNTQNRVRSLLINKFGVGSTYLAESSSGLPDGPSFTWHPDEDWASGLFSSALTHWWDTEQRLLSKGVGPRLRALWWMQGEQDALSTVSGAAYLANLQALWDRLKLLTGAESEFKAVIARIRDQDPVFDPVAAAQIRQAQADFVANNASESILINTDGFSLETDLVHYDAPGMKALGEAFYGAMSL